MKTARTTVAILLAVLAAGFLVGIASLNAVIANNRDRIQAEIQKALGRSVKLGEFRLDLWAGPALSAENLRLADDPRFAATPFIESKKLTLKLRLLPLLAGRVQIKNFILDEPEIQIIKNEDGVLNLGKESAALKLLASAIRVKNGTIDYIDRSSREPIALRARNVDLEIESPGPEKATQINFSANLFEGQRQNVSLKGRLGPFAGERDWSRKPVDLKIRFDSVLLPQLTRAVPPLREKISRYLDITGPFTLEAKLLGTFERPRVSELALTGSFFGSTSNNTTVKGDLDFSGAGSWEEGAVKASVAIDSLSLEQLKKIPLFNQAIPAALVSDGPISMAGDFQGSFDDLKMTARIKAGESEIRYGDWFKKEKGVPAEAELAIERQKERLLFKESTLAVHNLKMKFSGSLEDGPERTLLLRVSSDGWSLAGGEKFFAPLSSYAVGGMIKWDLSIRKSLSAQNGGLQIGGSVAADDLQAKDRKSGRGVEKMTARIAFRGKEARVEQLSFRLGSSNVSLDGMIVDFDQPTLRYTLRSARFDLADVGGLPAARGDALKSLLSLGEFRFKDGKATLRGTLSSPEGTLRELPYHNLRGEIVWSPNSLKFRNLTFQALSGSLRADGSMESGAENSQRLVLDPKVEAVDLKALLAQKFPQFKDNFDGQLTLKAKFRTEGKNSSAAPGSVEGEGETRVRSGSLKDFNLMQLVFSRIGALPGMSNLSVPPRYLALAERRDTLFDSLTGSFEIKQGRIYSKDLLLSAADYSVSAEGSMGFDKTMKWNAVLAMSPQFSQDLVKEYKTARFLLDKQGRLTIPFRLEGALPHVQVKPDLHALGEMIRKGQLLRGSARPSMPRS